MNLMEYCDRNQKYAIVLSLDFEKAFDKLEHHAIELALRAFGISQNFIDKIKILLDHPITTVINNGYWSDWCSPSRGCRQGVPISPLLFTLSVKILSIRIRNDYSIEGIHSQDFNILNVQYADDMWLALKPTKENLDRVLEELQKFEKFSGPTINYDKSVAIKLGPLRDSDARYYTMKKLFGSDGAVKILGIYFHPDQQVMEQLNYWNTLKDIEAILNKWTNRALSLNGKITVINSLIASKLVYKMLATPTPSRNCFKAYKQIILQFLWDGKPARIRYNKLIQNYNKNGLKLVDIEAKNHVTKAMWPIRWQLKHRLNKIHWLYMNMPIKDERLWLCRLDVNDINKYIKNSVDMCSQILKSWSILTRSHDFDPTTFYNTPLWYNSDIRRANEPFFHNKIVDSNINTLADIWCFSKRTILSYEEIIEKHGPNGPPFILFTHLLYSHFVEANRKNMGNRLPASGSHKS